MTDLRNAANTSTAVFVSPRRAACQEISLVLQAVGISSELARDEHADWLVLVDYDVHTRARTEIQEYLRDQSSETSHTASGVSVFGGAVLGVVFYIAILVSVAILANVSAYGIDWKSVGTMRAGDVMAGQVWRTVTALTLHADLSHLLSNLLFGSVFGLLVGRILGGGVAWLSIVIAGAAGNFGNALLRTSEHLSIGASTAVFAALGILVAHALKPRGDDHLSLMRRWSPLIAGVVMFAFLGLEGERTDVLAHASGLVAGVFLGFGVCRLADSILERESVQFAASAATILILVASWAVAV